MKKCPRWRSYARNSPPPPFYTYTTGVQGHPGQARMRHRTRGLDPTSARREWLTAKDRFVVRVEVDNNSSKGAFFPSPQLLRKLTRYALAGLMYHNSPDSAG